jgi:hypothetical protein
MRTALLSFTAISALLTGCGSDDGASTQTTPVDPDAITFSTGEFEVPPGDSFECFYTDMITDRALNVVSATGKQLEGGHHLTVYYADGVRDPQHHPCSDAEMVSWHQVAGASGFDRGEPVVEMPPGLAIQVPAGRQMVVQAHYINTTGSPFTASDEVTIHTVEADAVEELANLYASIDLGFEVAPNADLSRTSTFEAQTDLNTFLLLGHMHEWGKRFTLERIDDDGNAVETIYDTEWAPEFSSHPPVTTYGKDTPLVVPKGTKMRQTCSWENTTSEALEFPREMCVGVFYYYPDQGMLVQNTTPAATP